MMLQWGIRQSAEVMNQMMGVERVLEYRDLESEQKEIKKVADKTWPADGRIKFNNVIYRYADDMEPALKGVSFEVLPNEKIGIVGRTGVITNNLHKKNRLLNVCKYLFVGGQKFFDWLTL